MEIIIFQVILKHMMVVFLTKLTIGSAVPWKLCCLSCLICCFHNWQYSTCLFQANDMDEWIPYASEFHKSHAHRSFASTSTQVRHWFSCIKWNLKRQKKTTHYSCPREDVAAKRERYWFQHLWWYLANFKAVVVRLHSGMHITSD